MRYEKARGSDIGRIVGITQAVLAIQFAQLF
jgi:hypothetical protein